MESNKGTEHEMVLYFGKVVGVTFEPTKTSFKACIAEFKELGESVINPVLAMKHNPNNPFDPNAVEIWMGHNEPKYHIGFIPKTNNQLLLGEGLENLECRLLKVNIFDDKIVGFGIEVVKKPSIF